MPTELKESLCNMFTEIDFVKSGQLYEISLVECGMSRRDAVDLLSQVRVELSIEVKVIGSDVPADIVSQLESGAFLVVSRVLSDR